MTSSSSKEMCQKHSHARHFFHRLKQKRSRRVEHALVPPLQLHNRNGTTQDASQISVYQQYARSPSHSISPTNLLLLIQQKLVGLCKRSRYGSVCRIQSEGHLKICASLLVQSFAEICLATPKQRLDVAGFQSQDLRTRYDIEKHIFPKIIQREGSTKISD